MRSENIKTAELLIAELLSTEAGEEREGEIFAILDRICPDPEWSDLIFYSNNAFLRDDGSFDISAVVKKIFSYRPIIL
jgi:hypothetical protein